MWGRSGVRRLGGCLVYCGVGLPSEKSGDLGGLEVVPLWGTRGFRPKCPKVPSENGGLCDMSLLFTPPFFFPPTFNFHPKQVLCPAGGGGGWVGGGKTRGFREFWLWEPRSVITGFCTEPSKVVTCIAFPGRWGQTQLAKLPLPERS